MNLPFDQNSRGNSRLRGQRSRGARHRGRSQNRRGRGRRRHEHIASQQRNSSNADSPAASETGMQAHQSQNSGSSTASNQGNTGRRMPELPGMVWDPVRQRYFSITSRRFNTQTAVNTSASSSSNDIHSGAAADGPAAETPSSSSLPPRPGLNAYTKEAIREYEKQLKWEKQLNSAFKQSLRTPNMCTTLRLRARSTPKRIPTMQHGSYSQTIMDHTLAATLRYKSRLSPTDQIFNSAGGNPTITCMELFEDWNILVVANEAGFLSLIDLYDTDDDVTRSSHIVPIFTGTVSSLNRLGHQYFVWTSLGNSDSTGQIYFGQIGGARPAFIASPSPESIYSSKIVAPYSTTPRIVLGGTAQTKVYDIVMSPNTFQTPSGPTISFPVLWKRDTKSDTLAVTSDELQPCIVYSGCRDGGVRLFDIRVAPLSQSSRNGLFGNGSFLEENAGYKQRTSYKQRYGGPAHNSAISKLVNWGDHCLITSSLDNSICHWDIRMPSIPTIEYMPDLEPAAKFKEFSKRKYEAGSRCVCKYAGHINESTFGLGMAINSSKTVLAAGGEDGGVRMWDVNSGRLLSRTEPKEAASHRNKQLSGSTATTAADNTAQKNSRGNQGHLIDDLAFPSCQRAGLSANAQLVRSLVFYEPDQRYCTIREPESLRSVIEYGLLVSRGSEIAMYH